MIRTVLAVIAAAGLAAPAFAQEAPEQGTVRADDARMTCAQLSEQAAALSASMTEEERGLVGSLGAVARSGAALLVPGAGLVMAGADVMTSGRREQAESERQARRDRWNYLMGMQVGLACDGDGMQTVSVETPQTPAPDDRVRPANAAPTAPALRPAQVELTRPNR